MGVAYVNYDEKEVKRRDKLSDAARKIDDAELSAERLVRTMRDAADMVRESDPELARDMESLVFGLSRAVDAGSFAALIKRANKIR